MNSEEKKKNFFTKFTGQFWLVVLFEFFERGSYYGMMSFISVYFTDTLNIPKESVGVIKGVIQPLLYFLPILSGAIADRFGYRKVLMVAFALLGGGYFLTSQATEYGLVFAALVIMGFGAGTFKPIISGTIAKVTDESNSTQAFGIFYWSINLGAFLFPLFLVPFLKKIDPSYVIIASAICTAAMLIPTAFFFKEPKKQGEVDEKVKKREETTLIQTLANSFEIIYSPLVLMVNAMKRIPAMKVVLGIILVALLAFSSILYLKPPVQSSQLSAIGAQGDGITLVYEVKRNMLKKDSYVLEARKKDDKFVDLTIYKPSALKEFGPQLLEELKKFPGFADLSEEKLNDYIKTSDKKVILTFKENGSQSEDFVVDAAGNTPTVTFKNIGKFATYREALLAKLHETPEYRGITGKTCDKMIDNLENGRSFFWFFVASLIVLGLIITTVSMKRETQNAVPKGAAKKGAKSADKNAGKAKSGSETIMKVILLVMIGGTWLLPGIPLLGKIIASVIYFSLASLFIIDKTDAAKFADHAKFLLMIVLYSGFWILYFQMFDSVLWYVQAYVDAASLNSAVNSFLGIFGAKIDWFFDVEHVTVINAGTIIILQLVISNIVKNKKAMPTLITGFTIATIGMAMLAISTDIWIFMVGIILFSIGEMTAHPKFISYIGLIAPSDKKAMYMGYLFLYGVFGSSIGGVLGAKLYVFFVDNLNQPKILWLVFSGIGVLSIISLLLYNKFLAPKQVESK